VVVAGRRDPADPATPGVRYRVVVTETIDGDVGDDDYIDDVVFDHTGDAFVVGVATVSGNRITAEVNHDGDQFLRERLSVYITTAVLEP
jgi:ribosomal protein L21